MAGLIDTFSENRKVSIKFGDRGVIIDLVQIHLMERWGEKPYFRRQK